MCLILQYCVVLSVDSGIILIICLYYMYIHLWIHKMWLGGETESVHYIGKVGKFI